MVSALKPHKITLYLNEAHYEPYWVSIILEKIILICSEQERFPPGRWVHTELNRRPVLSKTESLNLGEADQNRTHADTTAAEAGSKSAHLVHDGQQLAEHQAEPAGRIAVLKLQCQPVLQLWHQDALPAASSQLVPARQRKHSDAISRKFQPFQQRFFLSRLKLEKSIGTTQYYEVYSVLNLFRH